MTCSLQLCGGDAPYLAPDKLERKHKEIREASLAMFLGTRKMGGVEFSKEYAQKLLSGIEESYENFVKLNDSKNIFNAARTPAVFFTLVVIAYFLSSVFATVGLLSFVRMFNLVIWAGLLAILLWSYVRFSGEFRELGARLDHLAELIWDEVSVHQPSPCHGCHYRRKSPCSTLWDSPLSLLQGIPPFPFSRESLGGEFTRIIVPIFFTRRKPRGGQWVTSETKVAPFCSVWPAEVYWFWPV